jgi:hypothetical protein
MEKLPVGVEALSHGACHVASDLKLVLNQKDAASLLRMESRKIGRPRTTVCDREHQNM